MKKILLGALAILMVIGFFRLSRKEQDQVIQTGQSAAGAAGKMIGSGYELVAEQAKALSPDSTEAQLEKAKKDLEDAKAKAKGKNESDPHIKEIQAQIDRLQSAITVKSLKQQIDDKVTSAAKAKENTEKTIDQVKDSLHKMDEGFRSLQQKLEDAQKAFSEADKKLRR